jgi:hypothetical protein
LLTCISLANSATAERPPTRIKNAGLMESYPHDVIITKEAPNSQPSQCWINFIK